MTTMSAVQSRADRCDRIVHLIDACLAEYEAGTTASHPVRRRRARPPREDR